MDAMTRTEGAHPWALVQEEAKDRKLGTIIIFISIIIRITIIFMDICTDQRKLSLDQALRQRITIITSIRAITTTTRLLHHGHRHRLRSCRYLSRPCM
jgi:hypothetical protein